MNTPSSLTFAQLIESRSQQAETTHSSPQILLNQVSALKAFMSEFGLTETSPIASHLRACYYKNLRKHLSTLASEERKDTYIANRKSLLGKWHSYVIELDQNEASKCGGLSAFHTLLVEIFNASQVTQRTLAEHAGISLASFRRWLSGARPTKRALGSIRRLERFFALEPGQLVGLAFGRNAVAHEPGHGTSPVIQYRQRQSAATQAPYALKIISDKLKSEWQGLLAHKTDTLPVLHRQPSGYWKKTSDTAVRKSDTHWHSYVGEEFVPTASICWTDVSSFLGWLTLTKENGGQGFTIEQAQSISLLADERLQSGYLRWKLSRANDVAHEGITHYLNTISSLTHPETGYLTQSPELAEARALVWPCTNNWRSMCESTRLWVNKTKRSLVKKSGKSRKPFESIQAVLNLPVPLEAVADMVARMKAERPTTNGIDEAIWSRDLVLVKILASNPVRAKNLQLLTYQPGSDESMLYRKNDGSWHLKIPKELFKNENGAAKDRDYDMPIDESAWSDIEQYLTHYRPMLPFAGELPYVFLSSVAHKTPGAWGSLNRHVFTLTKKYLWRSHGCGPHSFRYIVGTTILKAKPGDWETAADVLHDKESTVRKHYAHLKSADGGARMHDMLHSTFARM